MDGSRNVSLVPGVTGIFGWEVGWRGGVGVLKRGGS